MIDVTAIDVPATIQYTMDFEVKHNNLVQMNINDSTMNEEFLRYMEGLSEITRVDELGGGGLDQSSFQRRLSDKTFEDVIIYAKDGMSCGIKVSHDPYMKINDYQKWEGGYIECFIRMCEDVDYFIWQYVRMEHLSDILTNYGKYLTYRQY